MKQIFKYPRTHHLAGSRLGPGDEDLEQVPVEHLMSLNIVVEEKLDGANCGVSFDEHGSVQLQSRGHFLSGGPRERQFELFKAWANRHSGSLWEVLGSRYVVYGEWTYAKHTVFYDRLPHYFHEFDVLDTDSMEFLDTPRRLKLLAPLPVVSVPVLFEGRGSALDRPAELVKRSLYKSSSWKDVLQQHSREAGLSPERVSRETDPSDLAEGLYIKVEMDGVVRERYKWVRYDFLQSVAESGSHWQDRPLLPNLLRPGVDLFQ